VKEVLIDHMRQDLQEQEDDLARVRVLKDIETSPVKIGIYAGQEVALLHSISNLKMYIMSLPGEIESHVSKWETDFRIANANQTAV
jgi:hypothetical protein